ncbi:MAG: DUF998 domain-containing protein [Pseudomonadota bacterium]
MPDTIAKVATFALLAAGIVLPEALGLLSADYSAMSNYLSELGASGAPSATVANYLGFLPVSIAVFTLVVVLWQRLPRRLLIRAGLIGLLGISVGYLGAFLFPCDAGCPAEGSQRQALHNLAGLVQYAGAVFGLLLVYAGLRRTALEQLPLITLVVACWVLAVVLMMFTPELQSIRGLSQRLADYSLFLWLALATVVAGRHARPA